MLPGKSILITGASGFLLALMAETLLSLNVADCDFGLRVSAVVRNRKKAETRFKDYLGHSFFELVEADANFYIPTRQHDFIIHAASQVSPKYYGVDPVGTIGPNVLGTRNLHEYSREAKPESFLFFSSGEVYGQLADSSVLTKETDLGLLDPMNVRSYYAESKRLGETLCVSYWQQYGVPAKVVRPFHIYRPGMDLADGRVFADFVAALVERRNIVLNSDGMALRPFCYLTDAISGFFTVLLNGQPGYAYNIGNPDAEIRIRDLAVRLVDLFPNRGLQVEFGETETSRRAV